MKESHCSGQATHLVLIFPVRFRGDLEPLPSEQFLQGFNKVYQRFRAQFIQSVLVQAGRVEIAQLLEELLVV